MQLSFLGNTYTTSTPAIAATETQATVTFLGCSAKVKQFNVAQAAHRRTELYGSSLHPLGIDSRRQVG